MDGETGSLTAFVDTIFIRMGWESVMDVGWLEAMQRFVANAAIPASVFRAKGSAGSTKAAIDFLAGLDLRALPRSGTLGLFLDAETRKLCRALPRDHQPWATARKALNVFLRDALYNSYLNREYRLAELEAELETPVDGRIAVALHAHSSQKLPRWGAIKSLTEDQHRQYQTAASEVARRLQTFPVHLDVWFWRPQEEASAVHASGE